MKIKWICEVTLTNFVKQLLIINKHIYIQEGNLESSLGNQTQYTKYFVSCGGFFKIFYEIGQ